METLEPFFTWGNKKQKSHETTTRTARLEENRNPATRAESTENIGGSGKLDRAEMITSLPGNFGNPFKNVRDIEPSKVPSREESPINCLDQTQLRIQRNKISKVLDYTL